MVKITPEQKTEIITLKMNGARARELMEKYGISRAYVYKIMKENDIEAYSEVNTQVDINEINDMNKELDSEDIFNDLNQDHETIKYPTPEPEPEPQVERRPEQKAFLSAQRVATNYISPEKLRGLDMILNVDDDEKPKNDTQIRPKQVTITKDNTLSEDYPELQNTMNVIKRYVDTYYDTGKLNEIVGDDKRMFCLRLNELDLYQLKILLSNIQFKLSSGNCTKIFESGFFLITSQVEATSCYLNYDISGLTQALRHNEEVHEALKELSCKYDITKYVSPESRLIMAVSLSAYSIYQNNNMKVKFNTFLDKPVDEKIKETYKNL